MTDNSPRSADAPRYADRKFPALVDHGIAREDRGRAPCSPAPMPNRSVAVRTSSGTTVGAGSASDRSRASPCTHRRAGLQTQGDPFEPVKIGILIDMDSGQLIFDWVNATILAIEDALNEGVYDRPVEIIVVDAVACRARTT